MTLPRTSLLLATLLALAAASAGCGRERRTDDDDDDGGDGDADADSDADTDADSDADADADADGDVVPDPGDVAGGEWTDVEPNDDPSHAVPVGILAGPVWAGFVEPFTQLSSPDDTDFFVFATGEAATLGDVYISVCGSENTMDGYLSEVVDSRMGDQIATAVGPDTGCVAVVDFGMGAELLTATTTYVLEIRAQPGASAADFPVLYSA